MRDKSKYSNYGMIAAGLFVIVTFDNLSGVFFGTLGPLAMIENVMRIMLIAVLLMKLYNWVLCVPFAFFAVTAFMHGNDLLTSIFDAQLYILTGLMCFILLTDIMPEKVKDITRKIYFIPSCLWLAYNAVIIIIFTNAEAVKTIYYTLNIFMTLVFFGAHLFTAMWLSKPYKK